MPQHLNVAQCLGDNVALTALYLAEAEALRVWTAACAACAPEEERHALMLAYAAARTATTRGQFDR